MNKTLRTFILLAISLLICASAVTFVFADANIPSATSDFYVNDFAGVFTQAEKTKLMENAVSLANEHNGIQVVVTTVKSLEGDTVENYAYNMYNQYGIGKDDMGLLILLATEDRQIRVEVGRAMEGYINDAKAGRFIDKYAIPYLRENKFNEGLINLQEAFIAEIKACVTGGTTESGSSLEININWGAVLATIVIIVCVGGVAWLVILIVNKIMKKRKEKKDYIEGLEHNIKLLNSKIISLNSTIERQNTTNNSLMQKKDELQKQLNASNQSLAVMEGRYKRILTIYPDADKRVDEMIEAEQIARDKAAAGKVDRLIATVINLEPDKDLVGRLETIKYEIDFLTPAESKYLEADLDRFNNLYRSCRKLKREYDERVEEERRMRLTEQRKAKASDITKQLLGIIAMVGIVGANDLSTLRNAQSLYEDLDRETRSYVDPSAISKIEELLRRAKRAKQEEEEEEERRRRQASYNSSSSYRHSSSSRISHGGFGGRSGGGGASRGF